MAGRRLEESGAKVYGCCGLHQVLGDVAHPGGLKLTTRLAEVALLKPGTKILEIGAGRGTTAFYLAHRYGCIVTGIDLSPTMIASARNKAGREHSATQVSFAIADAHELPFSSDSFDVVVSECSLSLLPDKDKVVTEIRRVLKSGGKLTFTDLIIRDGVVKNMLAETAQPHLKISALLPCIAYARSTGGYIELLKKAGFQNLYTEDHSLALKEAWFSMLLRFGGMNNLLQELASSCPEPAKTMGIEGYQRFIRQSNLGYALIAATKPGERICDG